MRIMAIFNPLITLYYGIIFRTKFKWHSRKKKKKQKSVKNFLVGKFMDRGLSEKTINKLIDNYCKFGEIVFDRQILKGFLELDKTLLHQESKVRARSES
ncbi:MAG: hypothetical protein H7647_03990 [Candidatus Heimdallarchaeota archaeon]|nr:hypothetical protein [Candidatus Heimdallarchaeota archaeon]MCK4253589.1 hypothetical protein [Candidatus Heimdallarchaeota archaeon]